MHEARLASLGGWHIVILPKRYEVIEKFYVVGVKAFF